MNRIIRATIAVGTIFIMLSFVVVFSLRSTDKRSETKEDLSETFHETVEDEIIFPPPRRYVLKIEDGILVVFNETDMTRPIMVTDIYASTLRHFDRRQLNEGVVAIGEFELQTMLEDYSS